MAEKNTSSVVGIDKFYYAILNQDSEESVTYGEVTRVPYVQNVSIEPEQEIAKA